MYPLQPDHAIQQRVVGGMDHEQLVESGKRAAKGAIMATGEASVGGEHQPVELAAFSKPDIGQRPEVGNVLGEDRAPVVLSGLEDELVRLVGEGGPLVNGYRVVATFPELARHGSGPHLIDEQPQASAWRRRSKAASSRAA